MAAPRRKKRLGQHHLVEGHLAQPLVEFLRPRGYRVVEVGPGGGVLTNLLLQAGARVVAVELDLEWGLELARRHPHERLRLVVADAMRLDWCRLSSPTLVAGNLPYGIATALIETLMARGHRIPRAAFLVQREVAERLTASPGDPAYGSLSVLVAARAEARLLGRVKPGSFRPRPQVEGALVGLTLGPPPLPSSEMADFTALVRLAFSQRRKTLRNALASGWGRQVAEEVLERVGLGLQARAEALPLEVFVDLYRAWRGLAGDSREK